MTARAARMRRPYEGTMNLLWLIVLVLVILWLAGFSLNIGGSLIHLLVVIALVIIIWRLATGKRVV